jgi:hypothetical protein
VDKLGTLPFFLLNNSVKASDFVCSGKFSFKSSTKTEFELTFLGSSLDKVAAIPIMMKSPINEKMMRDIKLAKTILKKLFMYIIEVKKTFG